MAVVSTACFGYSNPPYPSSKDIDVNGTYLGRLTNGTGESALLDISLTYVVA